MLGEIDETISAEIEHRKRLTLANFVHQSRDYIFLVIFPYVESIVERKEWYITYVDAEDLEIWREVRRSGQQDVTRQIQLSQTNTKS